MRVINPSKLSRNRLGTAITTIDQGFQIGVEDQKLLVSGWSKSFPKVLVHGPEKPIQGHGVRHVQSQPGSTIHNAVLTYMVNIPGSEVCMLAAPDLAISGLDGLMKFVDSQRLEVTWGCHLDVDAVPAAFVLTSNLIQHLVPEIPIGLKFLDPGWKSWVNQWLTRMLRHRYFDGTAHVNITKAISQPQERPVVLELDRANQQNQVAHKKRSVVRKIKLPT